MKNIFSELPTEENLLNALEKDLLQRNDQLEYFYRLLNAQNGPNSIAVDGRWGSGKTFFIKQLILEINAKNKMSSMEESVRNRVLSALQAMNDGAEEDNFDLAIYYDAWANDNNSDPAMSIVYEVTKQLNAEYSFSNPNLLKGAAAVLDALSGRNFSEIIGTLKSDDPLQLFQEQIDLEERIKNFFKEILQERGERLVIFIDELDRCSPSYAVKLLEKIKHYFCVDLVTFVFSVNLEELQHTVAGYYGSSFDAYKYLDRFFDLRISLPPANKVNFCEVMGLQGSGMLEAVSFRVVEYFGFELREITHYFEQIKFAGSDSFVERRLGEFAFPDGKAKELMLTVIVPIVIGLKIANVSQFNEFIRGTNGDPLLNILDADEFRSGLIYTLLEHDESFDSEDGKKLVSFEEKIFQLYNAIFGTKDFWKSDNGRVGMYQFSEYSSEFVISVSNVFSDYSAFRK